MPIFNSTRTQLFHASMENAPKSENLDERIKALNDYHTRAVYKYTARGLFGRTSSSLAADVRPDQQNAKEVNESE